MKIKWGMYITDGVGKLGGHVIQRNHYGSFARTLVVPFNPQTAFQQARRAQHEYLTQNWKALSAGEQAAWSADSLNYAKTDALGNTYFSTGINHYISLNLNLWAIGQADISTPNTKRIPAAETLGSCYAGAGADAKTCIFSVAPPVDNSTIIVYCTGGLSAGINYVSTKYRSVAFLTGDGLSTDFDITTEYDAIFSPLTAGQKVFFKIVSIDKSAGTPNRESSTSTIVV